ncbi:MAG: sugar ABC transporter permease [Microbacterium sp.]|uniref:carbohydrate ABC transporter permease n=1 Tax=Microbacterium sp. TaxID=51671 RepID=UPI001D6B4754|nr:sugar ABC transporter permease [Microbacterium sp.]MBW8764569.1 sugar ABC transporter permease [Microbacterium sp.]
MSIQAPTAPPAAPAASRLTKDGPRRRWQRALRRRRGLAGYAYAAPTAAFVAVFFVVPLVLVAQMSVSDWGLFAGDKGVNAPDNFTAAVDQRLFWPAVRFTVKYTVVTTVILIAMALLLALLVQESTRWTGFLRTAILVPSALGLASASLLFYALYSPDSGPFGAAAQKVGLTDQPVSFLGTPNHALWSTVALIVWRYAGFYMLLLLVALQGISADVYEAAELDGAGRWQRFGRITLPLIRPTLALCTILCVTGSLLAFDQFYILTKGGPDNSTLTIVQLIYNAAFQGGNDLGLAAALSIIVLAALLLINAGQFRWLRGKES